MEPAAEMPSTSAVNVEDRINKRSGAGSVSDQKRCVALDQNSDAGPERRRHPAGNSKRVEGDQAMEQRGRLRNRSLETRKDPVGQSVESQHVHELLHHHERDGHGLHQQQIRSEGQL